MKVTTNPWSLMVFAATLMVSGCGGGGSEVATGPLPQQDANTLTLSGLVTDDPIVNAEVTFMVGTREFNGASPTGSRGEFALEIQSDNPDALVVGSAYDAANGVYLTAVLDTFEGCLNQATNNVVNDVMVTNITTAQQVLAERLALDGVVNDYAEFVQLLPQIDAMELLELSASIKTVVENINGAVLPTGYAHTLDLARAIADGSSSFNADIELVSPGTLAAAQDRLLVDGNATIPFAANEAPGVYTSVDDQFVYAIFADGSALVEQFDDNAVPGVPSWNISGNGKLQVNFFEYSRSSDSLTLMGGSEGVMHVVADFADPAGAPAGRTAATVNKYTFGAAFDASTVEGTFADPQFAGDDLIFASDGTGFARDQVDPEDQFRFVWSVTDQGHLRLDFVETARSTELIPLAGGDQQMVLSVTRYNEQWPVLAVSAWGS